MNICIYRGVNENGGSCIEVSAKYTNIFTGLNRITKYFLTILVCLGIIGTSTVDGGTKVESLLWSLHESQKKRQYHKYLTFGVIVLMVGKCC